MRRAEKRLCCSCSSWSYCLDTCSTNLYRTVVARIEEEVTVGVRVWGSAVVALLKVSYAGYCRLGVEREGRSKIVVSSDASGSLKMQGCHTPARRLHQYPFVIEGAAFD